MCIRTVSTTYPAPRKPRTPEELYALKQKQDREKEHPCWCLQSGNCEE